MGINRRLCPGEAPRQVQCGHETERVSRRGMTGNGNGGRRDTSAGAARRPGGHYARIQEATNKGRREKKARPKDNDVKETLGRRGEGMGSLCSRAKPQAPATMPWLREEMTRNAPRRVRREFTVLARVNSSA